MRPTPITTACGRVVLRRVGHGSTRLARLGLQLAAATMLAAPGVAAADNKLGGWSALMPWPLVPLHAVLLPDGRVLSYGTKPDGTQTGYFNYDLWKPSEGPKGFHLTLPNKTRTDLFCSTQLVLPQSSDVLLLGGDNWTGTKTTNTGNNNSVILNPRTDTLSRGANMTRARWYATATTLPNGEIYIQGGKNGIERPEIRNPATSAFRTLNGVDTSKLDWCYPRNFVAPNGLIFGIADQSMYYVDPTGAGKLTDLGKMPGRAA